MNKIKSTKGALIGFIVLLGALLIAIFNFGLGGGKPVEIVDNQIDPSTPQLISTNPPELFQKKPMVFSPDQILELNFNAELENGPETKLIFDPPAEVKVDITNDGKTAKISPVQPWRLGQGYTITIKPETKIKGGKTLDKEFTVHFNIINYSGI